MFGLSIINLWSFDVSTEYVRVKYVPSYIVISSSNCAKELVPIAFTALEVIVSGIENLYVVFSLLPTHIRPALSERNLGVASVVGPRSISSILIVAIAALFERGT